MLRFPTDDDDDLAFVTLAASAIAGAALSASTSLVHVVKIDNWFGDRWFSFAGKLLGAVGYVNPRLRVPPFHPHRVVSERRFDVALDFAPTGFDKPLHVQRSSNSNLDNSIRFYGDDLTIGWYSGNTIKSRRAAIMVYYSSRRTTSGWYVGLERCDNWQIVKMVEADARQWSAIMARSSLQSQIGS